MTEAFSGQMTNAEKIAKLLALVDDVKEVVELLKDRSVESGVVGRTQAKPILEGVSYLFANDLSV